MAGLWSRREASDAADRGLKTDACALRAALGTVSVDFAFDSAGKLWRWAAGTPGLAASNRLRIDHESTIGVAGLRLQREEAMTMRERCKMRGREVQGSQSLCSGSS